MMNPSDLLNTNRFVTYPNATNSNHNRKPLVNPFLTNNSIGPTAKRTNNLGLNHNVQYNNYINDVTYVVVDSRERNIEEFPLPNNYQIELNRLFTNIKKIKLVDINIANVIPPLNLRNNSLIWEYPTSEEATEITDLTLPTDNLTSNKVYLGTNLREGFYNTQSLATLLGSSLAKVKHQNEFTGIDITEGTSHHFHVDIIPETHLVKILNRLEECPIYAFQTILDASVDDVFSSFHVGPPLGDLSCPNGFYLIIRKRFQDDNGFPLVITGTTELVADICLEEINCQLYFGSGISGESYQYEFIDELDIGGVSYYRYKFTPPDLIVEKAVNQIFEGGNLDTILLDNSKYNFTVVDSEKNPMIGRAVPFRFFYQRSQLNDEILALNGINEDGFIRTVLEILGWNVKNDEIPENSNISAISYQYIHTNKGSYPPGERSFSSTVNGYEYSLPNRLLDIENRDNVYWFRSDDYIFMRLIITDDQAEWGNQIVLAGPLETPENDATNIYYNVDLNDRVPESRRLQMKNTNHIFAKIDLDEIPGNITTSVANYIPNEIDFKNEQLDELREVRIQFLDREGRLLNLRDDHHFVLEITTKRNVLENILMNTKNG